MARTDSGTPPGDVTQSFTITVRDANEFDPVADDATFDVAEDQPGGTFVGQVQATDADTSQTLTFAIDDGNTGGVFSIDQSTGQIVVAEGATHDATELAQYFKDHGEDLGFKLRVTILGHVQRGGYPGAYDRLLGTRLAAAATAQIAKGNYGVLVGQIKSEITATPYDDVVSNKKELDPSLFELANVLAK